jgi:hypothetical protein
MFISDQEYRLGMIQRDNISYDVRSDPPETLRVAAPAPQHQKYAKVCHLEGLKFVMKSWHIMLCPNP